jgi:hypothetical protein
MLARQQAVTKRQTVKVDIAADKMQVSFSAVGLTNRVIYFSPGITVTPELTPLIFLPAGGLAGGTGTPSITIAEKPGIGTGSKVIKVWLLTGATKEM